MLRVTLDKLEFESIREFEKIEVQMSNGVNVVQIRNGYGKSTTLQILRWMFTGQAPTAVSDFPLYIRGKDIAKHKQTEVGKVVLHMTIESGGVSNPWRLTLNFDKAQSAAWFETESPAIGGHEDGWKLPPEFRSKFHNKPAFTELFLFDGETAAELSKVQDHDQIINSIREVTGLRSIYQHIEPEGFLDKDRREAFEDEGVNNLNKSYSNWKLWETDLKIHIVKIEASKKSLELRIKKLEGQIATHEVNKKKLGEQTDSDKLLKQKERDLRTARRELKDLTTDLLVALGNPANMQKLWPKVKKFNANLLERKLPEGVGKVFFTDIVNADICICGRPMDKDAIAEIKIRGEKYLSDGILTVVNSMQSEVKDSDTDNNELSELAESISGKQYEITGIDEEISAITDDFDPGLQKKLSNIKELITTKKKELREKKAELDEIIEIAPTIINDNGWDAEIFGSKDQILIQPARFEKCKNLFSLRKVKRELDTKLAVAGPLQHINLATNTIQEIFNEALSNVMDNTHQILEKDTQEIFDNIPGKGGDKTIKLEAKGFRFYDTTSTSGSQTGINMGAMLAAAYSFVSAMSKLGSVEIPLVSDSPVTGMDPMTIEGWVQEVWPLFPQLVLLTTPGERKLIEDGPEEVGLKMLYSDEVRRMTIHREKENKKGKPQKGKMIVNEDQEWFKSYGARRAN